MSCLKRFPLALSYFFVFALVCSFFFLPGRVSATSVSSVVLDSNNVSSSHYVCFDNESSVGVNCSDYSYLFVELSPGISYSVPQFQTPYIQIQFTGSVGFSFNMSLLPGSFLIPIDWLNSNSDTFAIAVRANSITNSNNLPADWSLTFTLYDSMPGCSCPTCPVVPEYPYSDKLDKIYHAIILVPAMAFVLYLFFILYSWYCGGRK